MPDPVILSISSQVAYGHVGNAASVPGLQALGFEVMAVPTVLLAHHPGHGPPKGRAIPAEEVSALVEGLDSLGRLGGAAGMLSGYLGLPGTAAVVADAARRLKRASPGAIYLCDPVIGDGGRIYVRDGVEEAIVNDLLPLADIVTPNHFELERLAGRTVRNEAEAVAAARSLMRRGPRAVVITSFCRRDGPAGVVETLAVSGEGAWIAATPRLDPVPQGSGDLLAALFLGQMVLGAAVPNALARAVSAVHAVLAASVGEPEMRLVAERHRLLAPPPLACRSIGVS